MAEEKDVNTTDAPAEAPTEAAEPAGQTATAPVRKAPALPEGQHYVWGVGRRKKAIARVRIRPGDGKFEVNKRPVDTYFTEDKDRNEVARPLQTAGMVGSWDVFVSVNGGGFTGQAGAISLGLSRAICEIVPEVEHDLREQRLLTRDARMKERKKPGQPGARRKFQFSKR